MPEHEREGERSAAVAAILATGRQKQTDPAGEMRADFILARVAAGVLAVLGFTGAVSAEHEAASLFVAGASTRPVERPTIAATEWRRVLVNSEALTAEVLALELSSGVQYLAAAESIERRKGEDLAWRGHLMGRPQDQVVLTLRNGFVVGLIYAPEGVFEVSTASDGGQILARIDQNLLPRCAVGVESLRPVGLDTLAPRGNRVPGNRKQDEVDQIQLLSLYTPQARDAAGGAAAIEARIQGAVDGANTAFLNSGMQARYRLVFTALASHDDAGGAGADLWWLAKDPEVAALRDAWAADMVSLIVEGGGCGVAFAMFNGDDPERFGPYAFQVTARPCLSGLVFAHEHGHNLGMHHNPENAPPASATLHPWAFGHYHDAAFRTVMSLGGEEECPAGCPWRLYFSNPEISVMGLPTGIPGQRDNHLTGNLVAPFAANWRVGVLVFADGFEGGDLSAWSVEVP